MNSPFRITELSGDRPGGPFSCQPGLADAHEEGGGGEQIGWFRRNHLPPVPGVGSLEELSALIEEWDAADHVRRLGGRARTRRGAGPWVASCSRRRSRVSLRASAKRQ